MDLLGSFRISLPDGEVIDFRAQKTASLLAYLALNLDRTHSREELADLFWPDAYRDSGRMNLRTALSSLRRELKSDEEATGTAEILVADRQYIRLNSTIVTTDVRRFEEELRRAARETETPAKITAFAQAIALYRGPLLPGFYDDWVIAERERLQMLQTRALRGLVAGHIALGEVDRALEFAYEVLKLEPLDEENHAEVMRLHAAAGRTVAVTRQFRELQRRLREELDADPSEAIQALYQRLLNERSNPAPKESSAVIEPEPALPSQEAPALPTVSPPAPREMVPLPVPLTRFFGREEEIQRILIMLGAAAGEPEDTLDRIVTLTGPGGSGKTRLAIEVGRRLVARKQFPVCFVPLADVTQLEMVPGAILKAMNLNQETGEDLREQVIRSLAAQPGVLILDSFEQIADEGSELIQTILSAAHGLRLLVTSRQRLDIGGEQEFPVPPLPIPSLPGLASALEQIPSVQLFLDRAHAASPDFKITRENAAAVSAICERLDGIPLALELAAPWVRTLTPAQILARLDDRFQLLTSRRKDLPARHRTLRSAIDWSFQTLDPEVQRFFANLSLFRGGWTLTAAEVVCDEPRALDFLYILQERSLILAISDGDDMRYRFLETLREYGRKQLGEEEQEVLARRHATYFRDFAQERRPHLDSLEQATVLEQLEADHDNFRAALEWAIATPSNEAWAIAQGLCCALFRFWTIRGYSSEGRRWLRQVLPFGEDAPPDYLRAHVLYFAGSFALTHSDLDDATLLFTQALAAMRAIDDKAGIVNTICRLGLIQLGQRDFAGAEKTFREGLALARTDRNISSEGHLLKCLGVTMREVGDFAQARELFDQGLHIGRTWGDPHGISMMLGEQGHLAILEGDLDRAQSLLEEQLNLAQRLKAKGHQGTAVKMLARVALQRGNWEQADTFCYESIALFRTSGERNELAHSLLMFAIIRLQRNQTEGTAALLVESLEIYQRLGDHAALQQGIEVAAALAAQEQRHLEAARVWGAAEGINAIFPPPFNTNILGDLLPTLRQSTIQALGENIFTLESEAGKRLSLEETLQLVSLLQ